MKQINKHLAAIGELLWNERDEDAPLVSLTWTLAPLGAPEGQDPGKKRKARAKG